VKDVIVCQEQDNRTHQCILIYDSISLVLNDSGASAEMMVIGEELSYVSASVGSEVGIKCRGFVAAKNTNVSNFNCDIMDSKRFLSCRIAHKLAAMFVLMATISCVRRHTQDKESATKPRSFLAVSGGKILLLSIPKSRAPSFVGCSLSLKADSYLRQKLRRAASVLNLVCNFEEDESSRLRVVEDLDMTRCAGLRT
jgi:hypothetical protein